MLGRKTKDVRLSVCVSKSLVQFCDDRPCFIACRSKGIRFSRSHSSISSAVDLKRFAAQGKPKVGNSL